MTDENDIDMNAVILAAAGRTVSAEVEPADDEAQAKRLGDANAGVRPLPAPEPDMNREIRRAASRARHGDDGTPDSPLLR